MAGYGIVIVNERGEVDAQVHGALPWTWPQSAAAAEIYAVLRAAQLFVGQIEVATDNAAAVANCADVVMAARKGSILSGVYAALMRAGAAHRLTVRKVRGHQCPSAYLAGTAAWHNARGNQLADAAAKLGVQRHRLRATERMEMMRWAAVAAAAVAIGHQVWDLWPEVGRFDQIPRAPPWTLRLGWQCCATDG